MTGPTERSNEIPSPSPPRRGWIYEEELDQGRPILWPIIQILWKRRATLAWSLAGAALFLAVAGIGLYLVLPESRVAKLQIQLTFDGVDKRQYPNGIPFSPQDLIASEVLAEVYEINELSNVMPYRSFRTAWAIDSESPELWKLEAEYRAKLQETRLTQVDRDRLEAEYRAARDALGSSNLTLRFSRSSLFGKMPVELLDKVMADVPVTWARQAAERRGVLVYQVPLYTRNVIQEESIREQDYLVSLDILRNHVNRMLRNLQALGELPGADTIRIGEQQTTLSDIRGRLEDLLRFQVNPLIGLIRYNGLARDPEATIQYIEAQLNLLDLDRSSSEAKGRLYQDALKAYQQEGATSAASGTGRPSGSIFGGDANTPAMIPQLEGSFFDRLLQMGAKTEDVQFRQGIIERSIREGEQMVDTDREVALYRDTLQEIRRKSSGRSGASERLGAQFQKQFDGAVNEVMATIDLVGIFYETLSKQNLNPESGMFRTVGGVRVQSEGFLSRSKLMALVVVYFMAVLFVAAVVVVVRAWMREPAEQR